MLLIHGMPPYSVRPKCMIALLYSYACLALPFSQIIREYIVGAWCLRVFWARRQVGLQEVLEALLGAEPRLKICSECSLERDVQQFSVTSFCKGSERNCDFFSLWRMIWAQKPAYILTFKFSPYRKQGRSASLFIMNQVISHCFLLLARLCRNWFSCVAGPIWLCFNLGWSKFNPGLYPLVLIKCLFRIEQVRYNLRSRGGPVTIVTISTHRSINGR